MGFLWIQNQFIIKRIKKCALARGFSLTWDYAAYCDLAHKGSDLLEKGVYETFPDLKAQEPNWRVLHQEKQMAFLEIVAERGFL